MIISVRGTSGSGKSHLVRVVTAQYATDGSLEIAYPAIARKRRPLGQIFRRGDRRLFVPGHYEIANGGIDTMPSLEYAYHTIWQHHEAGCDVLYEGKNMSDGPKRLLALRDEYDWDCRVLLLDTLLEECVQSVRDRGHRISVDSMQRTWKKCQRDFGVFQDENVICALRHRDTAAETILRWLTDEKLRLDSAGVTTRAASTTS